jgi:hypothetical protein
MHASWAGCKRPAGAHDIQNAQQRYRLLVASAASNSYAMLTYSSPKGCRDEGLAPQLQTQQHSAYCHCCCLLHGSCAGLPTPCAVPYQLHCHAATPAAQKLQKIKPKTAVLWLHPKHVSMTPAAPHLTYALRLLQLQPCTTVAPRAGTQSCPPKPPSETPHRNL